MWLFAHCLRRARNCIQPAPATAMSSRTKAKITVPLRVAAPDFAAATWKL